MNPFRIYRDEWTEALSLQISADQYTTFVAMPFRNDCRYRADEVLEKVICRAATNANGPDPARHNFARPECVVAAGAVPITEEIVRRIMRSHIFLADLTSANHGVLLETGIALAVKPLSQVILISQESHLKLHFDIRNNAVLQYQMGESLDDLTDAFRSAAASFEEVAQQQVLRVRERLTPEAVMVLQRYAERQAQDPLGSIFADVMAHEFDRVAFRAVAQELLGKDLLWTDWSVDINAGRALYGMHATGLGWALIRIMWPDLWKAPADRPRRGEPVDQDTPPTGTPVAGRNPTTTPAYRWALGSGVANPPGASITSGSCNWPPRG